jgi:hypothetical protein
MTKYLILLSSLYIVVSCGEEKSSNTDLEKEHPTVSTPVNPESIDYQVKTLFSEEQGWGYQILKNGKPLINQPNIPAVQGNKGFSTKEKAEKTGQFVISKIYKGQFPPMVTTQELDSLNVI